MQQIQDVQKNKGVVPESGKRQSYQKGGNFGSPTLPNHQQNKQNLAKNAQQTALTLLLASQMQQQQNGSNGGEQLSPNSSAAAAAAAAATAAANNPGLLAALQAITKAGAGGNMDIGSNNSSADQFLNGIPGLGHGSNLNSLLTLASPNHMQPLTPLDTSNSTSNIPQGFFPSPALLLSQVGNNGSSSSSSPKEDHHHQQQHHWSSYKSARNTPTFGSNGFQKVIYSISLITDIN